jgi:hypothetical protein
LRFAYADPPYLGMCSRYGHEHHGGGCWDDVSTHAALIEQLAEYDGWALSCTSRDLGWVLPLIERPDVRVLAYCKTWVNLGHRVHPQYAWEPVVMAGSRAEHSSLSPTDWTALHPMQSGQGFFGNKPPGFTRWILACLGVQPDDQFDDLFPGSGAVTKAYEQWVRQQTLGLTA